MWIEYIVSEYVTIVNTKLRVTKFNESRAENKYGDGETIRERSNSFQRRATQISVDGSIFVRRDPVSTRFVFYNLPGHKLHPFPRGKLKVIAKYQELGEIHPRGHCEELPPTYERNPSQLTTFGEDVLAWPPH